MIDEYLLRPCPCCGAPANVCESTKTTLVLISCSKKGCKMVEANDKPDAVRLWNEPRFSQSKAI